MEALTIAHIWWSLAEFLYVKSFDFALPFFLNNFYHIAFVLRSEFRQFYFDWVFSLACWSPLSEIKLRVVEQSSTQVAGGCLAIAGE